MKIPAQNVLPILSDQSLPYVKEHLGGFSTTTEKTQRIPFHTLIARAYWEANKKPTFTNQQLTTLKNRLEQAKNTHNNRLEKLHPITQLFVKLREKFYNAFTIKKFATSAEVIDQYIKLPEPTESSKDEFVKSKIKEKKPVKKSQKETPPTYTIPENVLAQGKKATAISLPEDHKINYETNYEKITSFEAFEEAFDFDFKNVAHNYPNLLIQGRWDLQNKDFQNLALRLFADQSNSQIYQLLQDNANDYSPVWHLVRARTIAIATRPNIGFDGKELKDPQEIEAKAKEMEATLNSLTVYDWKKNVEKAKEVAERASDFDAEMKISVTDETSDQALVRLSQSVADPLKIGVPNYANAKNAGGGFQIGIVRSQEEATVTMADHLLVLWSQCERQGENASAPGRMQYPNGLKVPQGGAKVHKTHFFLNTLNKTIPAWSITTAFADFRPENYYPFSDYNQNEKLKDSYEFIQNNGSKPLNTLVVHEKAAPYIDRIKEDIRGYLLTAKDKEIEVVITGATGCGAFRHFPKIEAWAWKEVLKEEAFKTAFKEVVFAIPKGNSNHEMFQKHLAF